MKRTGHRNEQPRDRGAFRSDATDDQLYKLLCGVVAEAKPTRPEKLTQRLFDELAPAVAENESLPLRTAVGVYQRLGKPYGKKWVVLVREAIEALAGERDLAHTLAQAKSGPPDWYLDERYVHYGMQRAYRANDKQPIRPDRYDRLAAELKKQDEKLKRGNVLSQVMPTSNQIITICGTWEIACALTGIPAPAKETPVGGHPPIKLLEHYYETKERWPAKAELVSYANDELGISIPKVSSWNLTKLKAELVVLRAELGYSTPDDGPDPRKRRSAQELAALLEGAPRKRRPAGYWSDEENVLRALAEYVALFEGRADLRQKHYRSHAAEHGWPRLGAITALGEFQAMLDKARRWRGQQQQQRA